MAPFHDEHFLVGANIDTFYEIFYGLITNTCKQIINPSSQRTLVQFGLGDNYSPPTLEIPTKVYKHPIHPDQYISYSENESDVIYPIVKGEIVDVNAFNFFLKLIYKSILKKNPNVSNVPFLLISSSRWSKLAIEYVTQYVFESMELNAFVILPQSLAAVYAYGGQQNSVIIDIGYEKTEIIPIVDYQVIQHAAEIVLHGGQSINETLKAILPYLTTEKIELLKRSPIFEVLSDEKKKQSFFGIDGLKENDDEFDVAAIVTSGEDARTILEQHEKKKNSTVSNSQLEHNTFFACDEEITIGKERFKGTDTLIKSISKAIGVSLSKIPDLEKRQEQWDHIIVIGKTSKVEGFNEALNSQLIDDHLIGQLPVDGSAAFQANASAATNIVSNSSQVPHSVKFDKMPEYFPEWKKHGFEEIQFLGGQIVSKQIFGGNNDKLFVSRNAYNKKGPLAIWDVTL